MSETLIALRVALRACGSGHATEVEFDAILSAIATQTENQAEAETAARALHHRREARARQLELTDLLNARPAA